MDYVMFAHNGLYAETESHGTELGALIALVCLVTALVQSAFVMLILQYQAIWQPGKNVSKVAYSSEVRGKTLSESNHCVAC